VVGIILRIPIFGRQMEGDTGSVSDLYNINFATSPPQATDFHQHYSPKDSPKEKLFRLGGSSSDNTDSSGSGQRIRLDQSRLGPVQ